MLKTSTKLRHTEMRKPCREGGLISGAWRAGVRAGGGQGVVTNDAAQQVPSVGPRQAPRGGLEDLEEALELLPRLDQQVGILADRIGALPQDLQNLSHHTQELTRDLAAITWLPS